MKAAKLSGIALAILLTALVCQSRADLVIDMQVDTGPGTANVYAVNDPTETPLDPSTYNVTYDANNEVKGIQFLSAADVPAGGVVVVMDLYADVEDAGGHLTTWNNAYANGGATYTSVKTAKTFTWKTTNLASYDPTFQTLPTTTKIGTITNTTLLGVGNWLPSLDVGLNSIGLKFTNAAPAGTALPGVITASPNATDFSSASASGSNYAGVGGGQDLGGGNTTMSNFYASYHGFNSNGPGVPTIGTPNGYCYATGTTQNPNGTVNYVTLNGNSYNQLYVGQVDFTIGAGVAGTSAILTPAVQDIPAGPLTYWVEDGTTYTTQAASGNKGTVNYTAPVTISVSANASNPGAVGISGPTGLYSDVLLSGVSPLTFNVANPSANDLNNYGVSAAAAIGTVSALTPSSGSLAAGTNANATGTYAATGVAGPASNITAGSTYTDSVTGTVTTTGSGVTPNPATSTANVNVGAAGAPTSAGFSGNTLKGDVGNGVSYAGLASIVTSGSINKLGSVAELMGGTNNTGVTQTVTMTWRTRAANEMPGTSSDPPMPTNPSFLVSDVVRVAGVGTASSNDYVLEMTYDSESAGPAWSQVINAANGYLTLATLQGGNWVPAAVPTGATPDFIAGAYPGGAPVLGEYGVDVATHTAWAVVNYAGDFAVVVPEPGTFALLAAGLLAFVPFIRRRLKK